MKQYLLHTGPLSAYLMGRPWAAALVALWIRDQVVTTSVLNYAETLEYLRGSARFEQKWFELRMLLITLEPLTVSFPTLERYSVLRRQLRPPRGPGLIGDMDTLIASAALEHGLTLVTMDSDFTRVPGLKVRLVRPGEPAPG